jgi:hypothetical protein
MGGACSPFTLEDFMTVHINTPTATISGTTSSVRVAYPVNSDFVRVFNAGTTVAYVRSGDSNVVAAAGTGQFVPNTKSTIFRRDRNDTHIAAIMVSGSATIYISPVDADELVGF